MALLGGINVGGHRVKMTELKALFEALGFSNVSTFIASGNVIFEARAKDTGRLETRIELHLEESLGYRVPTFIRSAEELAAIADYQPFPDVEEDSTRYSLSVMFMRKALSSDVQDAFLTFQTPVDKFHIDNREIYWLCHNKVTESQVNWRLLGKTIPMPVVTSRSITTVRKLAAIYAS